MTYFDISKTDKILKKSWLWHPKKASILSFNRSNYHGDEKLNLDIAVRETVKERLGINLKGPIRILTHLSFLGYCFNPVSFYYCFSENDDAVELIMAEVTNTPWKERHSYFIYRRDQTKKQYTSKMKKEFHVSPFWGMDHDYEWTFSEPSKKLFVSMKNLCEKEKVFEAYLSLKREKMNRKNLFKSVLRFPFITLTVFLRIHWNAFKLWFKGAQFHIHPDKIS